MKPKSGDLVRRISGNGSNWNEIGIILDIMLKNDGIIDPDDYCNVMWSSGNIFWYEIKWISVL
jgi:hypothetical protein